MQTRTFDLLAPHVVLGAVESAYGLALDGTLTAYPSYVNRVYGLAAEDGQAYVAKFYRPGRWSEEAILEEHRFVLDCAEAELPVVAPIADRDGETLASVTAEGGESEETFDFALYPRKGGRSFDAESDEDWVRLGALVGRLHAVGARAAGRAPPGLRPEASTAVFLRGAGKRRRGAGQARRGVLRPGPGGPVRHRAAVLRGGPAAHPRRLPPGQHPRPPGRGAAAHRLRRHDERPAPCRTCGCCCRTARAPRGASWS